MFTISESQNFSISHDFQSQHHQFRRHRFQHHLLNCAARQQQQQHQQQQQQQQQQPREVSLFQFRSYESLIPCFST